MKNIYLYRNCPSSEKKISSVEEYEDALTEYKKFESTKELLTKEEKLNFWKQESEMVKKLIFNRCPVVLVAICPFCSRKVYANTIDGIFTLDANFWLNEYDDSRNVSPESICSHLFALDGAVHLQNASVPEKLNGFKSLRKKITMASEVPFIKPRILSKEGVVAIIHSISIAEKYVGYPVVYFSRSRISQRDFCIGWAREEYVSREQTVSEVTFSGKRSDKQDYDLVPWIEKGKLFWLDETTDNSHLTKEKKDFPYLDINGRRHPYIIQEGAIIDLPDSEETVAKVEIETFLP